MSQGPTGRVSLAEAAKTEVESEDRAIQRHALGVISGVFIATKIALMHRTDNKAFLDSISTLTSALEGFRRTFSGSCSLQFVGDATYVNRILVRVPVAQWDSVRYLRRLLERFGASELTLAEDFNVEGFGEFLAAVRETMGNPEAAETMLGRTFSGVQMRKLRARMGQFEAVAMSTKLRVLRAYGVGVLTLREVVHKVAAGRPASIIPLKRAMQDISSLPPETAPQQLSLLSLERYRQELAGRMMNVALLSMRIGVRIDLPTSTLRDLGVIAALHDIGRATRPDLAWASPENAAAAGLHLETVRRLTALRTGGLSSLLRTVVAFESGEPLPLLEQHPYTRIIAVAAAYEWMTQASPRGAAMLADEALRELLRASGTRFDSLIVKALVNTIGLYPVGTTVRLSTGETAVILEVPSDASNLQRPRVKIISNADGTPGASRFCDLSEMPGVTITGSVDTRAMDVNVGFFFFS